MTTVLSGAAINKLGDRLRLTDTLSDEDLVALQQLRREYDEALAWTRHRIIEAIPEVRPTSRLKTVQTLVGKLRRETTMNLSQVQDIAGLRIVTDMTLAEQDSMADRLVDLLPSAKLVDRRVRPSFGYRAVHIVTKVDNRLVEIQLRTLLQDRWAQIVERLADHWGRQIRYGQGPDNPSSRVGRYTRVEIVEMGRRLSPLIAECEKAPGRHGHRIHLSNDAFCFGVTDLLALFAKLDIAGTTR